MSVTVLRVPRVSIQNPTDNCQVSLREPFPAYGEPVRRRVAAMLAREVVG